MSSFAIGFCPYMSNEMPGWYQMRTASPMAFQQMNLGCMVLDSYNAWSFNNYSASIGNCSMAFTGLWQNMVISLTGAVSAFGGYLSGGAAGRTGTQVAGTGNFGSLTQGTGGNNSDVLNAEIRRLRKDLDAAKKQSETDQKIIADLTSKVEKNGNGGG